MTRGRTDGGLVRLITPIGEGGEAAADARLQRFLAGRRRPAEPLHPGIARPPMPDPTLPAPPPLVSILVISYNTRAMTLACLASVAAETTVAARGDRARQRLARRLGGGDRRRSSRHPADRERGEPRLRQGQQPRRRRGARRVPACCSTPTPWCSTARSTGSSAFAGRTPEAGIWGGRTLYADGSLNPMSVFGDQTLWSVFCRTIGPRARLPRQPRLQPRGHTAAGRATASAPSTWCRAASS